MRPQKKARSGWLVWVGGLLLTVAVLAGAGWWFLLAQIVPKIDQWRTPLMQQASKALGVKVHIGRVIGQNEGLQPTVLLEDVRLLDEAGRPALQLPRINARLSLETLWPTSLWRQEVHMDRLVLVKPQLDVRRDAQGRLHIAGLTLDPAKTSQGDSRATDWLLDQALIRIEGGSVTWTDDMRAAPPLQLSQVDVELRNRPGLGRRVHHWTLAATPPAGFGQRFEASANLTQPLWARPAAGDEAGWQQWLGELTRPSDWHNWSGHLEVKLPHVDVSTLQRHASLPIEVQGGRGRLGLSLDFERGRPQDVGLNLDVQAVSVKLGANLQPLAFKQLSGELHALHQPTRTSLSWKALTFTTEDGLNWPASEAQLQWQHPAAPRRAGSAEPWLPELQGEVWRHTTEGQFNTDRLDLALLARLADRLPLSDGLRQQLSRLNPLGVGQALHLTWTGPVDAPATYDAKGQLSGISWQAGPENPGLAGAAVSFKANEKGGKASLAIKNGWAEFIGAFEEPRIPLDDLKADVSWTITPAKGQAPAALTVEVARATFANADAEGTLNATWRTGPGTGVGEAGRFPGNLLLKGHLSRAQGNRVWRYLPAVILLDARHYVRDAVKGGYSKDVDFEVKGDLWHFPFRNNEHGLFRIAVKVEDATLDYVPRAKAASPGAAPAAEAQAYWPAFHQLKGDLIFEGASLRVENATAKLGETGSGKFELRQVKGHIDDLDSRDPVLMIEGAGTGPLDDLLKYVAMSPVGQWTGQMLGEAQGIGQGSLALALNIPLKHVVDAKVKGQVSLVERDQATLKLSPNVPPLQNARGQVTFTQDTLNVNAHAKVWGQDVQINGSRDAQGVPRFVANGSVSAEGLRTAQDWPALARLAQHMSGQTSVSVTVALPRAKTSIPGQRFAARPELVVSSNLQGLALNLPAPLNKEAMALWPLKVVHSMDEGEAKADTLLVDMSGPLLLKADIHRDMSGPQAKVQRGSVVLTQGGASALPATPNSTSPPAAGLSAQITLPALDVDAWQTWLSQFSKGLPATQGTDATEAYLPRTLNLKANTLSWRQRTLKNIALEITHPGPEIWRAQVDSTQVAGLIEWRPEAPLAAQPGPGGPTDRLVAHLTRLSVPAADAQAFEDQAAEQMLASDPLSVPALDIIIDQFEWRGLPMGKLEVTATNRINILPGSAPLPEWRLTKLRLSNADAQLNATGNWAVLGAQQQALAPSRKGALGRHRAAFSFTLDLANSGGLLNRLGLPQTLKGGKGKMAGQVAWLGSPLEPDAATMNGDINVAISEGQFLKADPGVAKLLGVLSLQSLPRRLILDFRDVFQQGFAFDRVDGDVKITQGVANTRNLRMRGVQALVLMEGQADLTRETQNLRVFVVPEINAGTASLAYAAINPAIGLGTFIAQVLLRKAVVEATTREFTITGPWADPQVDQVQRTTVPAAADEPASGPAPAASPSK
jgi:uncharacterized protein (TIGR02099 family)